MLSVEVKLNGIEGLRKKQVNDAMKRAMEALGKRWRRRYLPLHFGNQASARYGYTPRKGERGSGRRFKRSYTGRKLAFLGHTRPLEFTGEGKRLALNGPQTVSATRDKVRIPLPRKFNLRNPKSQVRMADEIRAVTPGEIAEMEVFLVDQIEREFAKETQGVSVGSLSLDAI